MSKVSRSIYQSTIEENKRLLKDIKILTENKFSAEKILCIDKWRKKFKEEEELNSLTKLITERYIKAHPDEFFDSLPQKNKP